MKKTKYAKGGKVCAKGGKTSGANPSKKRRGFAGGGLVPTIQPTNQTTGTARGSGAATRGTNFRY